MKTLLVTLFSILLLTSFGYSETFRHNSDTEVKKETSKGNECTDTNPLCKNGYIGYKKHIKWDMPFDPHEILDEWVVLSKTIIPPGFPFIIMGNPSIDWKKVPKDLDPGLAILPKEEKFAAIFFTFAILPDKSGVPVNEIIAVGYRDFENNGGRLVTHVLNKARDGYKKASKDVINEGTDSLKQIPGQITCGLKNYLVP